MNTKRIIILVSLFSLLQIASFAGESKIEMMTSRNWYECGDTIELQITNNFDSNISCFIKLQSYSIFQEKWITEDSFFTDSNNIKKGTMIIHTIKANDTLILKEPAFIAYNDSTTSEKRYKYIIEPNAIVDDKIAKELDTNDIFSIDFGVYRKIKRRSLADLAIYDSITTEEFWELSKEMLKDYTLCRCIEHGIKGYNLTSEDSYNIVFSLENFEYVFRNEFEILDKNAKILADYFPFAEYQLQEHGLKVRNVMLGCIDYYNSEKLSILIDSLLKAKKEKFGIVGSIWDDKIKNLDK